VIDETTEFGGRAARQLREDLIGWLTTVTPAGAPSPVPVWFLWEGGETVVVYSRPSTPKLRNLERNPRASLHLQSDAHGSRHVTLLGEARISDDPPADALPEFVRKYEAEMSRMGWSPGDFARLYSIPLRLAIGRVRGQ
jgi:PPOX class probable F420-dependent enzyme